MVTKVGRHKRHPQPLARRDRERRRWRGRRRRTQGACPSLCRMQLRANRQRQSQHVERRDGELDLRALGVEQVADLPDHRLEPRPRTALLAAVRQQRQRIGVAGIDFEHAAQCIFGVRKASAAHIEGAEVDVHLQAVGREPLRFLEAQLGTTRILVPILRDGTAHPHGGGQMAQRDQPIVSDYRLVDRVAGEEDVGQIGERIGMPRFACQDLAITMLGTVAPPDRFQRKPEVVEHARMARRPAQRALVMGDRGIVLALLARSVAKMERGFRIVRVDT